MYLKSFRRFFRFKLLSACKRGFFLIIFFSELPSPRDGLAVGFILRDGRFMFTPSLLFLVTNSCFCGKVILAPDSGWYLGPGFLCGTAYNDSAAQMAISEKSEIGQAAELSHPGINRQSREVRFEHERFRG